MDDREVRDGLTEAILSEPDAAFLKLQIARADLVRWLDAAVPKAARWTDWRDIGGQWYFDGVQDIKDISNEALRGKIAECDERLSRHASNRAALRERLAFAEAPRFRHASYDASARIFVAGTLTYSENLIDFLVFLTIARGAGAFLGADGYGIAVIHNYIFGGEKDRVTQAALRLGPNDASSFLSTTERDSAAGAFQALADEMLSESKTVMPVDDLDKFR